MTRSSVSIQALQRAVERHRFMPDLADRAGERVVLFLDTVRPLRAPMFWLNTSLIKAVDRSPFVKQAEERYRTWESGFAAQWERQRTDKSPSPV